MSRKLIVFIITCFFLGYGFITNEQWMMISIAYVGVEGFADIIIRYKMNLLSGISSDKN